MPRNEEISEPKDISAEYKSYPEGLMVDTNLKDKFTQVLSALYSNGIIDLLQKKYNFTDQSRVSIIKNRISGDFILSIREGEFYIDLKLHTQETLEILQISNIILDNDKKKSLTTAIMILFPL